MSTQMTKNGISTTVANGQEQYEIEMVRGKKMCFYDYRDDDGELFSTTAATLEVCRQKRDEWLKRNK